MLKIGGSHAEDTLEGRLAACHDRIRHFSSLAVKIATALDAPAADVAEAAKAVHRYFTIALPLHQADEDSSIASRIDAAAFAEVKRQHDALDILIARLVPAWETLSREPSPAVAASTKTDAEALAAALADHLVLEESRVFPLLGGLSPEGRAAILAEMTARRQ